MNSVHLPPLLSLPPAPTANADQYSAGRIYISEVQTNCDKLQYYSFAKNEARLFERQTKWQVNMVQIAGCF